MYGTQAQEWPHTHRARAAVEAAEEVAATAQVDQPVVGLAHDITDERDAENSTCSFVRGSVYSTVTSLLYFCHSSQVMVMRC